MKKITIEQLNSMLDTISKHPEKYTEGELTFSVIHPWSPDAWEVTSLMEEMILAGEDFGQAILVEQHVVDEESEIDFIHKDVNVYKQFVFPGESDSVFNTTISANLLAWLSNHRAYSAKPAVELLGEVLDIVDHVIPVDAFVVTNTFITERIEKEITIGEYLKDRTVTKGDIVRIVKIENGEVVRLEFPFLFQETYFKNEPRLFRVR